MAKDPLPHVFLICSSHERTKSNSRLIIQSHLHIFYTFFSPPVNLAMRLGQLARSINFKCTQSPLWWAFVFPANHSGPPRRLSVAPDSAYGSQLRYEAWEKMVWLIRGTFDVTYALFYQEEAVLSHRKRNHSLYLPFILKSPATPCQSWFRWSGMP